jgi:hypothetical protein
LTLCSRSLPLSSFSSFSFATNAAFDVMFQCTLCEKAYQRKTHLIRHEATRKVPGPTILITKVNTK